MTQNTYNRTELVEWLNNEAPWVDRMDDIKYSSFYMSHFNNDYTPYKDLQAPYENLQTPYEDNDIDVKDMQNNSSNIYDIYKDKKIYFNPRMNHFNVNFLYKRINERFNNYNKTIPIISRDNDGNIKYHNKEPSLKLNKEKFYNLIKESSY
jgi:hypothetical protein